MAVKNRFFFFGVALIILVMDQITKYLFSAYGYSGDFSIFKLQLTKNFGIGFGLLNFPMARWFLVILTVLIITAIVYYYCRDRSNNFLFIFPLSLILGGALGNLIDRIMYGFVIDFIDFGFWPSFNIADSAVTIGIILLIIYFYKNSYKTTKKGKNRKI